MKTLYRISDGGYNKEKLAFASKFYCLENYLKVFGKEGLTVFADNCKPETLDKLAAYGLVLFQSKKGSSAQSWRMVAEYAIETYDQHESVYFLEDDYLHKVHALEILKEGLALADYVTLYDNPDKYIDKSEGGNPLVKNGGEQTTVLLSKSTHWKITSSTTMTFACKVKTLKDDWAIWDEFTKESLPHDDLIFYKLQGLKKLKFKLFGKRRRLIVPIPGYATHTETNWLSPLVDWQNI